MSELLVRIVDKTLPDPYANQTLLKRGMVVVVEDDGWPWTPTEQTFKEWIIIKAPQLPLSMATGLANEPVGDRMVTPMLPARAVALDFNLLVGTASNLIGTGGARLATSVTLSSAVLTALQTAVATPPDPFIIGGTGTATGTGKVVIATKT